MAWVRAAVSCTSPDRDEIVDLLFQVLRAKGLDVTRKVDRSPGCLVTDAITSSLLGEISERAEEGAEVIVLAIDPDILDPQAVWRLLHAGADDVPRVVRDGFCRTCRVAAAPPHRGGATGRG